jgi:hypothetical protein
VRPFYIVLFDGEVSRDLPPILLVEDGVPTPVQDLTYPHGLRRDFIPALPLLWSVLQLPRWFYDTVAIDAHSLNGVQRLKVAPKVVLLPSAAVSDPALIERVRPASPFAVLAAPECESVAKRFSESIRARLGVVPTPTTTDELQALWNDVAKQYHEHESHPRFPPPMRFFASDDLATTVVPDVSLARQLELEDWYLDALHRNDSADAIYASLELHAVLEAGPAIEHEMDAPDERIEALLDRGRRDTRVNAVIGALGPAPAHARRAATTWQPMPGDDDAERQALRFLVAHSTAEVGGTALILNNLPSAVFAEYRLLEDHWASTGRPSPRFVWRAVRNIGRMLADYLGDAGRALARHARSITAFADFPIGLAILPNDTAPLCCRLPISYRTITPLTLAIQNELTIVRAPYWGFGVTVLVAECIAQHDRLAGLSQEAWRGFKEIVEETPSCTVDIVQVASEEQLSQVLAEKQYDVLILSAHGRYDREQNFAGIMIGEEVSLLLNVDHVPPVVLLSACHVAPRGAGVVTIADLLIALGAHAVLGAVVPISAYHNAILMTRLFVYICETLEGREPFRTLAEIWHHTISSNAVTDVYGASDRVRRWAMSPDHRGVAVDTEFKLEASCNRIHGRHIYRDTEIVLAEIADRRGFGATFRNTLRSQGYLPESRLYTFIGRPDHIIVKDRLWEETVASNESEPSHTGPPFF